MSNGINGGVTGGMQTSRVLATIVTIRSNMATHRHRSAGVKAVAVPVLAHRLILAPEARSAGLGQAELVEEALAHTPVPV